MYGGSTDGDFDVWNIWMDEWSRSPEIEFCMNSTAKEFAIFIQ